MSTGIVLMSRAPIPGQTKTRLETHLQPEKCARLHKAFLRDISQMLVQLAANREQLNLYLTYTPLGTAEMFRELISEKFTFLPQRGADLGSKMYNALKKVSEENEQQLIIGSDLPTLQPAVIEEAVEKLQTSEVVLGPSQDGGYYLLGTKQPRSFLFSDIVWGQNDVLRATIEAVKEHKLTYQTVASWADIDVYPELLALAEQLATQESWERFPEATAQAVEEILPQEEITREEEQQCPTAR